MNKINLPKVLHSKTPKSYKNKKLNNANFGDFSHNDYQVFLHLISKIGGVDEYGKYLQPHELQREHILTAKEFSSLFNTNIHHSYRVLKKEGIFCPSLHVVYPVWSLIKNYIKYFDKNHPHHLLEKDLSKMLLKYFPTIINTYKINMIKDHSSFTFKNIFKNNNKIRGLKRFLSNYFLYTTYYQAQK
jgi:hypothetical protein